VLDHPGGERIGLSPHSRSGGARKKIGQRSRTKRLIQKIDQRTEAGTRLKAIDTRPDGVGVDRCDPGTQKQHGKRGGGVGNGIDIRAIRSIRYGKGQPPDFLLLIAHQKHLSPFAGHPHRELSALDGNRLDLMGRDNAQAGAPKLVLNASRGDGCLDGTGFVGPAPDRVPLLGAAGTIEQHRADHRYPVHRFHASFSGNGYRCS
jgi:hypothetical protein